MNPFSPSHAGQPVTIAEFERLPDDGYRHDLVRGYVVREPPPGGEHGEIAMEIGRLVANHVHRNRLGRVFTAETGFVLADDPPTVRAPDLAFVAAGRLPPGPAPRDYPRLATDLAVEVVSPSNSWADVATKVRDYLEAGSRLVWIVDPQSRTVTIHRGGDPPRICGVTDTVSGDDVLPGFRLRVERIFAAP